MNNAMQEKQRQEQKYDATDQMAKAMQRRNEKENITIPKNLKYKHIQFVI